MAPPFRLFGIEHLLALALIAGACASLFRCGARVPERWRLRANRFLAVLFLVYAGASYTRLAQAGLLNWQYSLPLQLCDLTLITCFTALLTRNRWAFELSYYWGLSGAVAALVTPDLRSGFPSPAFLLFFIGHGIAVLVIFWLIAAECRAPQPGSVWRAFFALNLYALLVGGLDAAMGWNYGYLRERPSGASPVDHMGPWPWYIVAADVLALAMFAALYLPWALRRGAGRSAGSSPAPAS